MQFPIFVFLSHKLPICRTFPQLASSERIARLNPDIVMWLEFDQSRNILGLNSKYTFAVEEREEHHIETHREKSEANINFEVKRLLLRLPLRQLGTSSGERVYRSIAAISSSEKICRKPPLSIEANITSVNFAAFSPLELLTSYTP